MLPKTRTFSGVILLALSTACTIDFPLFQSSTTDLTRHTDRSICSGPADIFEIRSSPGKGLGVFALHTLETGDIILRETPTIVVTPPEFIPGMGFNTTEVGIRARTAFGGLSEAMQEEVMSLTAHYLPAEAKAQGFDLLMAIFRSNAYNTGEDLGLFVKIARINHSCRPNASYSWVPEIGKRVVYANRRIEAGEEISVSYIPLLLKRLDRQQHLDTYGFICSCDACAMEDIERKASDRRRRDIREAFDELEIQARNDNLSPKKLRRLAGDSLKLVDLVEKEQLPDYFARAYYVAAVFLSRTQRWAEATIWAKKSIRIKLVADADSDETKEIGRLLRVLEARTRESGKP